MFFLLSFFLFFFFFFFFCVLFFFFFFFLSGRRPHTRLVSDWSSDVCSSDLGSVLDAGGKAAVRLHRSRGSPPGLPNPSIGALGTALRRTVRMSAPLPHMRCSGPGQARRERKSVVQGKGGERGGARRAAETRK